MSLLKLFGEYASTTVSGNAFPVLQIRLQKQELSCRKQIARQLRTQHVRGHQ